VVVVVEEEEGAVLGAEVEVLLPQAKAVVVVGVVEMVEEVLLPQDKVADGAVEMVEEVVPLGKEEVAVVVWSPIRFTTLVRRAMRASGREERKVTREVCNDPILAPLQY